MLPCTMFRLLQISTHIIPKRAYTTSRVLKNNTKSTTMSQLEYSYGGKYGQHLSNLNYYSQAVRLPANASLTKISGQTGRHHETGDLPPPDSAENVAEQVSNAFEAVDVTLRSAGSKNGWGDVYLARTYIVGIQENEITKAIVGNLRKWCPEHRPCLTAIEVKGLFHPDMRIEVEVEAWNGAGGK